MMYRSRLAILVVAVSLGAWTSSARAHFGQRVWVDRSATGTLLTMMGPPGGSPAGYSPSQFTPGRVFVRDMGSTDIAYTTMLGGPVATDDDADDDGVTYQTNFPGYEVTPFPSYSITGTLNVAFTRAPLYYQPGLSGARGHFVSVAQAFAGKSDINGQPLALPFFTIDSTSAGSNGNVTYTITSPATDALANPLQTAPAFTAGGHGHPGISLHPNPLDDDYAGSSTDVVNDLDEYDGIYAIGLRLSGDGYQPSDTYYLVLGKNASLADLATAGLVAQSELVPEPSSMLLVGIFGVPLLLRRRR